MYGSTNLFNRFESFYGLLRDDLAFVFLEALCEVFNESAFNECFDLVCLFSFSILCEKVGNFNSE